MERTIGMRGRMTSAVAVSTIVVLGATLAGCAQTPAPGDNPSVVLWLQNGGTTEITSDFITTWGEENGVDVKVEVQASDTYGDTLALALRTGKGPDVFESSGTQKLTAAGYLAPLDDLLSDEIKEVYADAIKAPSPFVVDGSLRALPTTTNTIRLAYNKDVFAAAGLDATPPETYSELLDVCEAISQVEGKYCFGLPLAWAGFSDWMTDPLVTNSDPDLTQKGLWDADAQQYDMSAYADTVELFRTLIAEGYAYPGASSLQPDPMRSAFSNGELAMFVSAAWDVGSLNGTLETTADWAAGPLPHADGAEALQLSASPGTPWALSSTATDAEASVKVIEALASKELLETLGAAGLVQPMRADAAAALADADVSTQFLDYAFGPDDVLWNPAPTTLLNVQTSYQAVLGELILGTGDIQPALDEVSNTYSEAYTTAIDAGELRAADFSK